MNALHASSPIFVVTHIQGVKIERRYWDISKSGLGNLSSLEGIVENLNSMDSMSVQSNEVSFFFVAMLAISAISVFVPYYPKIRIRY